MAQCGTKDGVPGSANTLSVNNTPAMGSVEPIFKIPAPPEKRKRAGGVASNKEMKPLEPSLPTKNVKQEPMEDARTTVEEPLISAACIKVEPMDIEDTEEVLPDEFVTADILNVENKLKKQLDKERRRMEKQMNKKARTKTVSEEELCNAQYNRLVHLMETSNFYSNFMKEKLKDANIDKTQNVYKERSSTDAGTGESSNGGEINTNSLLRDSPQVSGDNKADKKTTTEGDADTYTNSMGLTVPRLQPRLFEGGVLRDYQVDGFEWLRILDANNVSGILADEMGLGKTIQVIAIICHLIDQGIPGPFLIVAPLSTIPNWMAEFQRFAPQIPTLLLHGTKPARDRLKQEFNKQRLVAGLSIHPVVVTSFQILLAEKMFFRGKTWRYLVVDEGHRIKNNQTQLAMELKCLNSVTRLILTGTPLQNNLSELWALLNFLLPDVFSDLSVFKTWFDCKELLVKGGEDKILAREQEKQILSTMHQILSPFLLRRLKTDVELELPPKKERLVFCPLTPTQKQLYSAVLDKSIDMMLLKQVTPEETQGRPKRHCVEKRSGKSYFEVITIDSDSDSDWEASVVENNILTITDVEDSTYKLRIRMQQPLMALRHIVNHPYLVQMPVEIKKRSNLKKVRIDEDLIRKSGKMLVLDAILAKLKQRGHKVLIFSSFTMMLDLLADFMELRGYEYCNLDGRVTLAVRQEQIRRFNTDPETFVFLISTRAGGLGINLTAADTVITYDSDWNPQADLQAQDRCHRIGQTRPVVVYRLATEGTVDQVIIERAVAKRKLEKMIIQNNAYNVGTKVNKVQAVDLVALRTLLQSNDFEAEVHSNGYVFDDHELEVLLDRSSMQKKKKKNSKL